MSSSFDKADFSLLVDYSPPKLKGRWYTADRTNVGESLQEWKRKDTTADELSEAERGLRLSMLEGALLEGRISEETYDRLRRKHEA